MKQPRKSLSDFKVKPSAPPEPEQPKPPPGTESRARNPAEQKGAIVLLSPEAHRQLRQMALDLNKTNRELLVEAVNLLFREHGRPEIA